MMMDELGEEPDPNEIPPIFDDLIYEAQEAWIIYNSLQDVWEGMSGTFMGKNKAGLFDLFKVHETKNIKEVLTLISIIENEFISYYQEQQKQNQKSSKKGR